MALGVELEKYTSALKNYEIKNKRHLALRAPSDYNHFSQLTTQEDGRDGKDFSPIPNLRETLRNVKFKSGNYTPMAKNEKKKTVNCGTFT